VLRFIEKTREALETTYSETKILKLMVLQPSAIFSPTCFAESNEFDGSSRLKIQNSRLMITSAVCFRLVRQPSAMADAEFPAAGLIDTHLHSRL
jgi:hypothetical protein